LSRGSRLGLENRPFRARSKGYAGDMRPITKTDLLTASLGALSLLAGVIVLVAAGGEVASIVGAALLGLAGILFVALAFLIVGEGEDRDRGGGAP
jgi:hypothetical protein